jgi:integrase/recombinase XerC
MEISQLTPGQLSRDILLGYITSFLNSLSDTGSHTYNRYDRSLREFARWFDRDGRLLFAVDDVFRYRDYLHQHKKFSPSSISTHLSSLRRFCDYLQSQGVIAYNPAKCVRGHFGLRPTRFVTLTQAEVNALLRSVDRNDRRGARDATIIHLMVQYGVAENELVRLSVRDYVCFEGRGALKIRATDQESTVALQSETTALLNCYLALRAELERDQPLFLSDGNRTRGMRMTTGGIRTRVTRFIALAGIKHIGQHTVTPQTLRHTAAALLAQSGCPVDEIRYRMRFGSLATAKRYLTHVAPSP